MKESEPYVFKNTDEPWVPVEKPPLYKGPWEIYEEQLLPDGGIRTTILGQVVEEFIAGLICKALTGVYKQQGYTDYIFAYRRPLYPAILDRIPPSAAE